VHRQIRLQTLPVALQLLVQAREHDLGKLTLVAVPPSCETAKPSATLTTISKASKIQ
jgi:hypothetical protein